MIMNRRSWLGALPPHCRRCSWEPGVVIEMLLKRVTPPGSRTVQFRIHDAPTSQCVAMKREEEVGHLHVGPRFHLDHTSDRFDRLR